MLLSLACTALCISDMLAFDIETEGLQRSTDRIIVASVYDPDRGVSRTFHFMKDPAIFEAERADFIQAMDEAPALCSFNGIRFDIPFIAARLSVHHACMHAHLLPQVYYIFPV